MRAVFTWVGNEDGKKTSLHTHRYIRVISVEVIPDYGESISANSHLTCVQTGCVWPREIWREVFRDRTDRALAPKAVPYNKDAESRKFAVHARGLTKTPWLPTLLSVQLGEEGKEAAHVSQQLLLVPRPARFLALLFAFMFTVVWLLSAWHLSELSIYQHNKDLFLALLPLLGIGIGGVVSWVGASRLASDWTASLSLLLVALLMLACMRVSLYPVTNSTEASVTWDSGETPLRAGDRRVFWWSQPTLSNKEEHRGFCFWPPDPATPEDDVDCLPVQGRPEPGLTALFFPRIYVGCKRLHFLNKPVRLNSSCQPTDTERALKNAELKSLLDHEDDSLISARVQFGPSDILGALAPEQEKTEALLEHRVFDIFGALAPEQEKLEAILERKVAETLRATPLDLTLIQGIHKVVTNTWESHHLRLLAARGVVRELTIRPPVKDSPPPEYLPLSPWTDRRTAFSVTSLLRDTVTGQLRCPAGSNRLHLLNGTQVRHVQRLSAGPSIWQTPTPELTTLPMICLPGSPVAPPSGPGSAQPGLQTRQPALHTASTVPVRAVAWDITLTARWSRDGNSQWSLRLPTQQGKLEVNIYEQDTLQGKLHCEHQTAESLYVFPLLPWDGEIEEFGALGQLEFVDSANTIMKWPSSLGRPWACSTEPPSRARFQSDTLEFDHLQVRRRRQPGLAVCYFSVGSLGRIGAAACRGESPMYPDYWNAVGSPAGCSEVASKLCR